MLHIGCCGFGISRKKYYLEFPAVELQDTFYNPPDIERMLALRKEAPPEFIFNMKAWQAISHDISSPTWKRAKTRLPHGKEERYGNLRQTKENLDAWESVLEGARALRARTIIIQTPPKFGYSTSNMKDAKDFFSSAAADDFIIGWEPRGTWNQRTDKIREVIEIHKNIIHIVDPFKRMPALIKGTSYFRLHGIGGEINYRYRYTDGDLSKLKEIVGAVQSREIHVMFNNMQMLKDAKRFMEI